MLLQEPDLQDFLNAFNKGEVKYLIVGGAAVILHGYARTTVDLDIWVERSEENYLKICKAFQIFGMPVFDMTYENFFNNPNIDVFTFGRPPVCIDLMLAVKGLDFEQAFKNSVKMEANGILFSVVSKADLITAKKSVGRHKDLDDAEQLSKREKNAT
jgi:hypothetical protein